MLIKQIWSDFTQALGVFWKNYFILPIIGFFDLLFLFIGLGGTLAYFQVLQEYLAAIFLRIAQDSGSIADSVVEGASFLSLIFDRITSSGYFFEIILLLIIATIFLFIAYNLLQAFAWSLSGMMFVTKCKSLREFKHKALAGRAYLFKQHSKFLVINLFWGFIILILLSVNFLLNSFTSFFSTLQIPVNLYWLSMLLQLLTVIVLYFQLISYTLLIYLSPWKAFRKCFIYGITFGKRYLPAYMIIGAFFAMINIILVWLGSVNFYAYFISGLILVILLLSFARVYMQSITETVKTTLQNQ